MYKPSSNCRSIPRAPVPTPPNAANVVSIVPAKPCLTDLPWNSASLYTSTNSLFASGTCSAKSFFQNSSVSAITFASLLLTVCPFSLASFIVAIK